MAIDAAAPPPPPPLSLSLSAQAASRRLVHPQARALLARSTCIHTQLRDLLVCPELRGELVAVSYQSLARYTLPSAKVRHTQRDRRTGMLARTAGTKHTLQQLPFIPNVLVKGCGLLASGGHQAEFHLRSTSPLSTWSLLTSIGSSINNSISISPSPTHPLSTPRLCISNNDGNIYRYEVSFPKWYINSMEAGEEQEEEDGPVLRKLKKVGLDTPVNHCSTSPDGRWMVAVGDTNEVHVMNVNAAGHATHVDNFEASTDASFSTAWSRTGLQFAVASQDGTVSIFDIRSYSSTHRPIARFRTLYSGTSSGSARVLKYSPGPNEILAFSEQKGYIHLVDARTYEYTERLHVADTEMKDGLGYQAMGLPMTNVSWAVRARTEETRGAFDDAAVVDRTEYNDLINVRNRAVARAAAAAGERPRRGEETDPQPRRRRGGASLLGAPASGSHTVGESGRRPVSADAVSSSDPTIAAREQRMRQILAQLPSLPASLRAGRVASSSASDHGAAIEAAARAEAYGHLLGADPNRERHRQSGTSNVAVVTAAPTSSVNPWDTFSTDDASMHPAANAIPTFPNFNSERSPTAPWALSDGDLLDEDMDEDDQGEDDEIEYDEEDDGGAGIDEDDDERYHRQIMEAGLSAERAQAQEEEEQHIDDWCPIFPLVTGEDGRLPQSGRMPSRTSSSLFSHPAPPSPPLPLPFPSLGGADPVTVARLLGNSTRQDDGTTAGIGGVGGHMSSITGLDWDPTGRWLYASMEKVVLEWEVNEQGRRCLPSAGFL